VETPEPDELPEDERKRKTRPVDPSPVTVRLAQLAIALAGLAAAAIVYYFASGPGA